MIQNEVFNQLNSLMQGQSTILNIVNEIAELRMTIEDDTVLEQFVNTTRGIVQREAKWAVIDAGGRGLVAMATGSGKSKVAIELHKYYAQNGGSGTTTLIVPTEKLRDENWKEEYSKWQVDSLYSDINRICYASSSKISDRYENLVILDECHNITELASDFFTNNDVTNIIALTATEPTDEIKKEIFRRLGIFTVYTLTLDNAVKLGFVAPYKITVVYTELDDKDKYIEAGNKVKRFMQTELARYNYLTKIVMMRQRPLAAINRMQFLASLRSKTLVAQHLLTNVIAIDDRKLIFCGSINQAEFLSNYTFHSKTSDEWYQKFKIGEINELSCVEALNEGANFKGLDTAIITQVNSKEKNLIQRIGRMIRFRPGHEAHIYIIVCKDTQDEKWLASCTENLDQSKIEYINSKNF